MQRLIDSYGADGHVTGGRLKISQSSFLWSLYYNRIPKGLSSLSATKTKLRPQQNVISNHPIGFGRRRTGSPRCCLNRRSEVNTKSAFFADGQKLVHKPKRAELELFSPGSPGGSRKKKKRKSNQSSHHHLGCVEHRRPCGGKPENSTKLQTYHTRSKRQYYSSSTKTSTAAIITGKATRERLF